MPLAFSVAPAFLALAITGPVAKWIDLRRSGSRAAKGEVVERTGIPASFGQFF